MRFQFVDKILKCDHPNLQAATEQSFPIVLFIMTYTVVLTFEFLDQIPKCDHYIKRTLQSVCVWMKSRSMAILIKAAKQSSIFL